VYSELTPSEGLPKIYWYGTVGKCRILVMEVLGGNLEELFNKCRRKFSVKTVCMIAHQAVNAYVCLVCVCEYGVWMICVCVCVCMDVCV